MAKFFFKKLKDITANKETLVPKKIDKERFLNFKEALFQSFIFFSLLFLYVFFKLLFAFFSFKIWPKKWSETIKPFLENIYFKATSFFDRKEKVTISRIDLIELAVRNMKVKKTRSLITIGGMAIGIGAIVFLVSLGYGLENLVTNKVARLEELRQADTYIQAGSKLKIDDRTLSSFKDIKGVEKVLPLIAVVGKISYQNSVSDMAVYGVTSDYLKESAIKPVEGGIFDSNELTANVFESEGEVAGAAIEKPSAVNGEKIQEIEFSVNPEEWVRVRSSPSANAKILGYTRRIEGKQSGEEFWGGEYIDNNNRGEAATDEKGIPLGRWVKAPVLLWENRNCLEEPGCENGEYIPLLDKDNSQKQELGYFAETNLQVEGITVKSTVLGVSSSSEGQVLADESIDWVEIASEAGLLLPPETKKIDISPNAKRLAVVNRAMAQMIGLKDNEVIGKKFETSFIVTSDLLSESEEKIESNPVEYEIVGLIPEGNTPIFYVPFVDLRGLGITNYSQAKIVVKDKGVLPKIRSQIGAMGYITRSVADTVAQINSLFTTIRSVLALLGMVALAVASLGMFNTLTVSLLERTREVGLMKALGMKSSEVKELFLTESMVMGIFGGISGLLFGFLLGKLLGLFLTIFSLFKGVGVIDISFIPFSFVLIILFLSLLVGLFTGLFPAKRATKISALNALRYE